MAIEMKTENVRFFIGSDNTVLPVLNFETKEQEIDKVTGLPVWRVQGELINGEEVESVRLKITSKTAPELASRTEYVIDGSLFATPYESNGRVAISYKLNGALSVPGKAFPVKA